MSPVLDARTNDFDFLLINIYNAKAEKEQVSVFNVLTVVLYNSPVFCLMSKQNEFNPGKYLGIFNNSLISNTDFVKQMKQLIEYIKQQQLSESEQTNQVK